MNAHSEDARKTDNKIINLAVIDRNRDDYGDPWEEFNRIVLRDLEVTKCPTKSFLSAAIALRENLYSRKQFPAIRNRTIERAF
jgi:aminoglycoside phosphotransferase (APT) family kinase protein